MIPCANPCDHNCHHDPWHHFCQNYHTNNHRNWWQYSKQTWITKTNNLKQGHRQSKIIDRYLYVAQLLLEVTWVRFLRRPTWPNTQTLCLEKWAVWSIKMRQKRKQERQRCVAATKHIFENVSKSIKAIVWCYGWCPRLWNILFFRRQLCPYTWTSVYTKSKDSKTCAKWIGWHGPNINQEKQTDLRT